MNKTILIYDTEESSREALKTILGNIVNLVVVESALQCRQVFKQKTPVDLAFICVDSGESSCAEFFGEIRDQRPSLAIIAIGSHKSEDTAAEAVRHGATGYMIKPFKADQIRSMALKK
jgi:DNA-binding NtrC family response regulator